MAAKIGATVALDGEKSFRQAISGINSDFKVLRSEMNKVSAEFADNANTVNALTAKDEILNKQLDKQKEKVEALKKALENSVKQYGENDTITDAWKASLNNAEAELTKLNKKIELNDRYLKEAESSTDGTAKSIDQFGKKVKEVSNETLSFGDVLKANLASDIIISGVKSLGYALKNAAEGTVNLVADTAAYADEMLTLSAQTGVSTDKLQAYNYMAELTDTSLETLTSSMAKNIKSMTSAQNGSENFVNAYKKLKVDAIDPTTGALRDSETVYWEVIDALKGISDETTRDSLAMQIFGKSAQDLNTLISQGSEGVKSFTDEAENMGAVLDKDTLTSLGETDDALQRLTQASEIAKRKIGAEMAPALTSAAEKITDKITNMDDGFSEFAEGALDTAIDGLGWVIDNAGTITGVVSGVAAGMAAFKAGSAIQTGLDLVNKGWTTYKTVTEGATVAQYALNLAQNLSPVGVLATAIGAVTAGLVIYNTTTDNATEATNELSEASNTLHESIQSNIKSRDENNKSIEEEYGALKSLSDTLYDLSDNESLSNEEKAQMTAIVKELNDELPGLNLTLNEQTGLLNKQKTEIYDLIDANLEYYKVKAAQEDLVSIAEEQYKAEIQLNEATEEFNKKSETQLKVMELKNKGWVWLTDSEKSYVEQNENVLDEMASLSEQMHNSNDDLTQLGDQWNKTKTYIGEHSEIDDTSSSVNELGNITEVATETVQTSLDTLKTAYDEAKTSALDSIQSQIDIFDEFVDQSEVTKEELLKNLKSQVEGITEWADNIESLSNRGINEGLLANLKEMGPSAAAEIAALNSMTDDELQDYSKKWEELGEATTKAAETSTSDLKDAYQSAFEKMQFDLQAEAIASGQSVADGIKSGLDSKKTSLSEAAADLGNAILDSFKKKLEIHSPSKRAESEGGAQFAIGVINGINSKKENAKKSAADLGEIIVDAAKKKLETYEVYNDLSLEEEVDFWNEIRKQAKKGTDARIEADKEYYDAKKSLLESQKSLEEDYKESVEKTNSELIESIKEANQAYEDAVSSRAEIITDSTNLFEEFNSSSETSGVQLLANLQSQTIGLQEWRANLAELQARGIDDGLLEELQNMGPDASGEIAALNTLTDEQLQEYVKLWEARSQTATDQAISELTDLKTETVDTIKQLKKDAETELDDYYNIYTDGLKNLGITVKSESETIGSNIATGIISGMESQEDNVLKSVSGLIASAIASARTAGDIHSPSGKMADLVGEPLAEGIGVGFVNAMAGVNKDIAAALPTGLDINSTIKASYSSSGALTSANMDLNSLVESISALASRPVQMYMGTKLVAEALGQDMNAVLGVLSKSEARKIGVVT